MYIVEYKKINMRSPAIVLSLLYDDDDDDGKVSRRTNTTRLHQRIFVRYTVGGPLSGGGGDGERSAY